MHDTDDEVHYYIYVYLINLNPSTHYISIKIYI
jgi:hypothetical protein